MMLITSILTQVEMEALVHDAYHCQAIPSPHARPWPTQRNQGILFCTVQ